MIDMGGYGKGARYVLGQAVSTTIAARRVGPHTARLRTRIGPIPTLRNLPRAHCTSPPRSRG